MQYDRTAALTPRAVAGSRGGAYGHEYTYSAAVIRRVPPRVDVEVVMWLSQQRSAKSRQMIRHSHLDGHKIEDPVRPWSRPREQPVLLRPLYEIWVLCSEAARCRGLLCSKLHVPSDS